MTVAVLVSIFTAGLVAVSGIYTAAKTLRSGTQLQKEVGRWRFDEKGDISSVTSAPAELTSLRYAEENLDKKPHVWASVLTRIDTLDAEFGLTPHHKRPELYDQTYLEERLKRLEEIVAVQQNSTKPGNVA